MYADRHMDGRYMEMETDTLIMFLVLYNIICQVHMGLSAGCTDRFDAHLMHCARGISFLRVHRFQYVNVDL